MRATLIRLLVWAVFSVLVGPTYAQEQFREHEIKARFIILFAQYVSNDKPDASYSSTICLLGHNPFGDVLEELAVAQSQTSTISIREVSSIAEAQSCFIVFVDASEQDRELNWFTQLKAYPILTVGESGKSIERGAIIEFKLRYDSIVYEVNLDAARESNLKISTAMLTYASVVYQGASK